MRSMFEECSLSLQCSKRMNNDKIVNAMREERLEMLEKIVGNLGSGVGVNNVNLNMNEDGFCDSSANGIVTLFGTDFYIYARENVDTSNCLKVVACVKDLSGKDRKPILNVCNTITQQAFDVLMKNGVNIIDAAGNCFIRYRKIFIYIQGRKGKTIVKNSNRIFNEAGLKLIFYFLQSPDNISKPYRKIHEDTDLSLGSIKNVIEDLKEKKMMAISNGSRFLLNRGGIIDQWVDAYVRVLKPKLFIGRMTFINADARRNWQSTIMPKGVSWGGESGAFLIDGYLNPEKFSIYTNGTIRDMIKSRQIVPSPNGEIEVFSKFWNDDVTDSVVSPILVYADLMGSGDSRCLEAAERIKAHGL